MFVTDNLTTKQTFVADNFTIKQMFVTVNFRLLSNLAPKSNFKPFSGIDFCPNLQLFLVPKFILFTILFSILKFIAI